MAEKKKGLGMGLSALLGEDEAEFSELDHGEHTKTLDIARTPPGTSPPRHGFVDEATPQAQVLRADSLLLS